MSGLGRAIGIDIGATKIAVAAVDGAGRIHARAALATRDEPDFDRAVERIAAAVDRVLGEAGWRAPELHGLGLGCAGPLSPALGTIRNPYTFAGWDDRDIVSPLARRFGTPVRLENDADAALAGERWLGAARGRDPVVLLTYGTGIGGAAAIGGEIVRGAAGEHPELGHVPAGGAGPECYCGRAGCLESLASGLAIERAGREAGYADCRAVFAAADRGEAPARAIVERAVRATETAAWALLHAFAPERIVLGGGIAEARFETFAAPFRDAIARAALLPGRSMAVVPAELGNDAGVLGAARIVLGEARDSLPR